VRRFTALSNTTAALFAHEVANPLQGMSTYRELIGSELKTKQDPQLTTNSEALGEKSIV
jgi:nitrogen-specific signal transduction histidine kinase